VAVRLAREVNDAFARVIRERPGRFTALATLPLNDPPASASELERAMKDLGLPGAMVFSNVDQVALTDERFEPLWKKADALGAVILRRGANGGKLRVVVNWTEELTQILAAGGVR
jgi:predicted TIM-barrel fold metal-dependent hydrolase